MSQWLFCLQNKAFQILNGLNPVHLFSFAFLHPHQALLLSRGIWSVQNHILLPQLRVSGPCSPFIITPGSPGLGTCCQGNLGLACWWSVCMSVCSLPISVSTVPGVELACHPWVPNEPSSAQRFAYDHHLLDLCSHLLPPWPCRLPETQSPGTPLALIVPLCAWELWRVR